MESSKGEESGEMYSPDEQGEYIPEAATPKGVPPFPAQGLMDTLITEVPDVQLLLSVEFALQLKVMMADCLGHPCPPPPAFSWNVGMVMHILKSDPMLRDLEHIQVDGPGTAYLFFDKQGRCRLTHETAQAMQAHVGEAFGEWISFSAHFAVNPLPLAEGWCHMVVASERPRHRYPCSCPERVRFCSTASRECSSLHFHDIFALDNNELGCTSVIEHEICINDSEPFKEQLKCIPPLLLEEVHASLCDMLDAGAICPS